MNKRILSVFLTICMVVGLFPSLVKADEVIVIKPFIDPPETPVSEIIKRMEEDIPEVPSDVVTPYGTGENITLLEKSELFINTPNGLTGTYKLSDSLRFTAALGLNLSGLKFVQSVGFDPTGCGKKNCIAVMGFKPNADNKNGALHVFIYNLESKRLLKTYVIDDGYMSWIAQKLDTVDANNFFSITAGDYNGDGRDSLVIYDGIFRGSSGDIGLKEIIFDGTNWKDPVNVSVTRSRNELFNPTYMKSSLKSSWDPGNRLSGAATLYQSKMRAKFLSIDCVGKTLENQGGRQKEEIVRKYFAGKGRKKVRKAGQKFRKKVQILKEKNLKAETGIKKKEKENANICVKESKAVPIGNTKSDSKKSFKIYEKSLKKDLPNETK